MVIAIHRFYSLEHIEKGVHRGIKMIKKHLAKAGIIMIVGMLSAIDGLVS